MIKSGRYDDELEMVIAEYLVEMGGIQSALSLEICVSLRWKKWLKDREKTFRILTKWEC